MPDRSSQYIEARPVYYLIAIITVLVGAVSAFSTLFLYRQTLEEYRQRLLEQVTSVGRLIEAVARFDNLNSQDAHPDGAGAATLSQIIDAYSSYSGLGQTSEMVFSRSLKDQIHIFLRFKKGVYNRSIFVPLNTRRAIASKKALEHKKRGSEILIDYRGEETLAAYTYIPILEVGLVIKTDLAEIRQRHWGSGIVVLLLDIFVIFICAVAFSRFSKPILLKLRQVRSSYKQAQQKIETLSQRILQVQDAEREVISQNLHDNIASPLVWVKFMIQDFFTKKGVKEEDTETYKEILQQFDNIIEESRGLSHRLSPTGYRQLGLEESIRRLGKRLEQFKGISTRLEIDGLNLLFENDWNTNLYRIAQEALTNVMKHSQASAVDITFQSTPRFATLVIRDNGVGFNAKKTDLGLGLSILYERARALGGELRIESKVNYGTEVIVELSRKT